MEFLQTLFAILGAISIAGGGGAVIYKVIRPAIRINERVSALEVKADKDFAALQSQADADRAICHALLAILDHAIYGNHIEKLEEAKERVREYLIKK
jgi:hypothetical protein